MTLLEARPRLGGLDASFRRGDLTVDNGQHVFLRCCTGYRGSSTGSASTDSGHAAAPARRPGARSAGRTAGRRLRREPPAGAAAPGRARCSRYPALALGRAGCGRSGPRSRCGGLDLADPALDDADFGAGWPAHGQTTATVAALWDLVGVATLNARRTQASLALAAKVFQTGLLTDAGAADIGWSVVPLGDLHGLAARTPARTPADARGALRRPRSTAWSGVATRGWSANDGAELREFDTGRPRRRRRAGERLLPPGSLASTPAGPSGSGTSPIVNVHVVYDRPVLDEPFVAGVGIAGAVGLRPHAAVRTAGAGQYLAVSLSAADDEIDLPAAELRDRYRARAARRCCPAPAGGQVRDFFVTRERTRPSGPAPGTARAAPGRRDHGAARGWRSPARGPPPAGPRRWRARCAAAQAAAALYASAARAHRPAVPDGEHEWTWCDQTRQS